MADVHHSSDNTGAQPAEKQATTPSPMHQESWPINIPAAGTVDKANVAAPSPESSTDGNGMEGSNLVSTHRLNDDASLKAAASGTGKGGYDWPVDIPKGADNAAAGAGEAKARNFTTENGGYVLIDRYNNERMLQQLLGTSDKKEINKK